MSKFSDLIQKKNEMLKVTMKVDPAACKNGEITHFKEYVGFVLAEKEFEKTYEKLLKQYTLQNEGFFDTAKGALKAIAKTAVNNVVDPFKNSIKKIKKNPFKPFTSSEYNPFVGQTNNNNISPKNKDIIEQLEGRYLDSTKILRFVFTKIGSPSLTFKQFESLINQDSRVKGLFINSDLNKQIEIRKMQKTYIPYIIKEIEDLESNQKIKSGLNSNKIWNDLVNYVESIFKDTRPTKNVLNKKILWMYILTPTTQTLSF